MFYPIAHHDFILLRGKPLRIVSRPLDGAVCWAILGVVVTLLSGEARAQTSPAVDSTSTLIGVYTDEQAKRGKEAYLTLCRSCHVPSTGDGFARRWAGKTLLDLFNYIYETMPDNNPRSVDEFSNADIIGYLMQATGMPVGTREVPVAADSLKAIRIEVKKPGPPSGIAGKPTAPAVGSREGHRERRYGLPSRFAVRIDHAPDCGPARQLPLTTAATAFSKRSAIRASPFRSTLEVHVPEYSSLLPAASARQAPVHPVGAFAADHPPFITVLPCPSTSAHVPVIARPVESGFPVHVPINVRPLALAALHVPERSACAPDASMAARNSRQTRRKHFRSTGHLASRINGSCDAFMLIPIGRRLLREIRVARQTSLD
jgi:hypothetical protein